MLSDAGEADGVQYRLMDVEQKVSPVVHTLNPFCTPSASTARPYLVLHILYTE